MACSLRSLRGLAALGSNPRYLLGVIKKAVPYDTALAEKVEWLACCARCAVSLRSARTHGTFWEE
jgi:hypothetical protein